MGGAINGAGHVRRGRRAAVAALVVGGMILGATTAASAGSKNKTPAVSNGSMAAVAEQVGADQLWADGITGEGVNVAVIDTGVVPVPGLHDDDKIVAVVDLSGEARVPEARYLDTYGHGTHMAGIIAGDDDTIGFRGIAPDAGIVSVKVADSSGAADISQVIAGVDWVVEYADELDIRIINLSYSSGSPLDYEIDPLTAAVERAWHAGIVVVVAAGNDGRSEKELASPADDPYVISVAGVEVKNNGKFTVPNWATSGDGTRNPDVAAPGTSIESLRVPGSRIDVDFPSGYVDEFLFKGTGSSQAAAVVSGGVALLLDARPELTPDQVKELLQSETARVTPSPAKFSGAGVIQLDEIIDLPTPGSTQDWTLAAGTGSIETARNGLHVEVDGIEIVGEITVLGEPWEGAHWSGAHWSGAHWSGAHWSSGEWMGAHWSGAHWSGAHWSGAHWSGAHWSGAHWSGAHWSGAHWSGAHWSGAHWSGAHWSGSSWSGAHWSGAHWSGAHWSGAHWSGAGWS